MGTSPLPKTDPALDLVLERVIDTPPALVWTAWTTPEHLMPWFCPAPWTVTACEIDLRPGGIFSTTMRSAEGKEFSTVGCYLEIVPQKRLVWTDALLPGFRPGPEPFMTGIIQLDPHGAGTRYTAIAKHRDEANRKRHAEMGFEAGWGKALDQLIAYAKSM